MADDYDLAYQSLGELPTFTEAAATDFILYHDVTAGVKKRLAPTSTQAEEEVLSGVTAGTATASKAVVLGASKEIATITSATITTATIPNMAGAVTFADGTTDVDIASHDGTNGLKLGGTLVTATATEINLIDGVTATTAEINSATDVSARLVTVADSTPYTVLVADSGKIIPIPLLGQNTIFNLPTAASGLEYRFMMVGTAAEGDNWAITCTGDSDFIGGVGHLDTDGELNDSIAADGSSKNTLTVVAPGAGTLITVLCDGTDWFVGGSVFSVTVPTFTDV